MKAFSKIIALGTLLCTFGAAQAQEAAATAPALSVGSTAPAMSVAKWIKGTPVKNFEKGKVYVVEFWATWCGPCKQSIPHLTELAKKFGKKATFTGVSVWEDPKATDNSYIAKVDAFVKDWGPKMDYNVAADGHEGTMAKTWMAAAGQNGIPTAFVVDQNGKIAWIGHPLAGTFGDSDEKSLETVVEEVYEHKFDAAAEKAKADARMAKEEEMAAKFKPFQTAMMAKKYKDAVAELDKLFAEDATLELPYGMTKFMAMTNYDVPGATAYAKKLSETTYKDESNALNSLAWGMVDPETDLKGVDYKVAVEIAQRGVATAKDDMSKAMVMDTLALAQWKSGDKTTAVKTQEEAVRLASSIKDFDAPTLGEMKDRLATYKKG